MAHFAVSAIGKDRRGIVANMASGLLAVEGNIEDSRMTILHGNFVVMLIVSVPDGLDREGIVDALADARDRLELDALTVSEVAEDAPEAPAADHVITVYGSDHPGIVHAVSTALADAGTNVVDLQTQLAGGAEAPLYVMLLEVALGEADPDAVRETLAEVGSSASVEVGMRPIDAEPL